jgi:hypothetical protein
VAERRYPPYGALEPLPLLELGVHEKLSRRWDFALVLVSNDLRPRTRIFTIGVPSSALETIVLSSARLGDPADIPERLAALALHLLGHVWGLEHEEGLMTPPEDCGTLRVAPFPAQQQDAVAARLAEVADARLEEQSQRWNRLTFYWHSFWADPRSIVTDTWGYAPWRLPFRMGRLTAAAAISILLLLLGAEAWEIGVNLSAPHLVIGAAIAIFSATIFLFWGQNLGEISRDVGWREQLIRTRIVVFGTVLVGTVSLWIVLFVLSYLAALSVPSVVPARWLDVPLDSAALARHAAFMASLGVLAGAFGGNLEDEDAIKAELFFDEET